MRTLLETCWQLRTQGGHLLTCEIHRDHGPGVEVRVGFSDEDPMRTQWMHQITLARELAAGWKQSALDGGGFEEVAEEQLRR